jgi:phage FluMu gp28-like protein
LTTTATSKDTRRPAVELYGYQQRWLQDPSRFRYGLMSRQVGKSFVVSLDSAIRAARTCRNEILLSAGMRQSKELMEKVAMHFKAMNVAASQIDQDFFADAKYTLLQITLNNGAKVIGLPANPDTARGFTGNVTLDEFAFHRDSRKIWTALFPTISRGFRLSIVTTPQGFGNQAHDLWNNKNNYSKHLVDIYTAVKDGCPQDIEELREGLNDEDAWAQEYECRFIDDSSILLTYEMITACQDQLLAQPYSVNEFTIDEELEASLTGGELFAGLDVGRKKDLSVLTVIEQISDTDFTRLMLEMPKTAFSLQRELVGNICRRFRIQRLCVDSTGIGLNLSEDLQRDLGSSVVEPVSFTLNSKSVMANRMRQRFEDRRVRIPVDRNLRDDLHKIKKTTTAAGNVRYDASADDKGHADRFWSLALALEAKNMNTRVGCTWL